jgi:hypothetical protein
MLFSPDRSGIAESWKLRSNSVFVTADAGDVGTAVEVDPLVVILKSAM